MGSKILRSTHGTVKCAIRNAQEGKRFCAVNAENLTKHFPQLYALKKYGSPADRIWNLDETVVSPGRDSKGRVRQRRFLRRHGASDAQLASFSHTSRITLLPSISAAGDIGSTLFIFKGSKQPYCEALVDGQIYIETLSLHLPRGALVRMSEEVPSIDSDSFYEFALKFTAHVRHLTNN